MDSWVLHGFATKQRGRFYSTTQSQFRPRGGKHKARMTTSVEEMHSKFKEGPGVRGKRKARRSFTSMLA